MLDFRGSGAERVPRAVKLYRTKTFFAGGGSAARQKELRRKKRTKGASKQCGTNSSALA
jgi:hypothetical protein